MEGMPWREARGVGDRGEDLACAHLVEQGWEVVERNWRCREGELDVVALDPDGQLVFCEVKTRRSARCGAPIEAVGQEKAQRLRRLAWAWLAAHGRRPDRFRIDVIGVLVPPGRPAELQHLRAVA
ncbi:YraN family protein [Ornithinimicrobium cerasi]|uniref:YraN family protein n=1 Tax=Ornithinimicrobium cerasi TaxID=2248773 RepID=UPI000F004009|nr:YraN family protein [Ornithinimicrobium cerasi]